MHLAYNTTIGWTNPSEFSFGLMVRLPMSCYLTMQGSVKSGYIAGLLIHRPFTGFEMVASYRTKDKE